MATSTLRLLLVEDHPDSAELLAELLELHGHHVVVVATAHEALAAAAAQAFDLVVSDVGLPDLSGYDLMRQLRDRHALKGIAVTGTSGEGELARGREAGFGAQLVKPVAIRELIAALDQLTASGPAATVSPHQ